MENIDIRQFTSVSGVEDADNVLLSRSSGGGGKIRMSLFLNNVKGRITPEIGTDGYWYIGGESTGVVAEGRTPQFTLDEAGISYRYTDDEGWTLLVPINELGLDYEMLTPEQRAELKLKFDDLTEEDIAELQRPANDMIDILSNTETEVRNAEAQRVQSENERIESENAREESENTRTTAETTRISGEESRVSAENGRVAAEEERKTAESERKVSENARKGAENERMEAEIVRGQDEISRSEAEHQRRTNETVRQEQEQQRQHDSATAVENAEAAASRANEIADHPPMIGERNWMKYNERTKEYEDTGVYAAGNIIAPTFDVDVSTGELILTTPAEYSGPDFLLENGDLCVTYNS